MTVYTASLVESTGLGSVRAVKAVYAPSIVVGFETDDVASWIWRPGYVMVEGIGVGQALTPVFKYHLVLTESSEIDDLPSISQMVVQIEGVALASVLEVGWLLTVLEGIRASVKGSQALKYNMMAIESAALNDLFTQAVGAQITTGMGLGGVLGVKYIASVALTHGLELNDTPPPVHMIFHPTLEEGAELDDLDIVKMIYKGEGIVESANIYLLYGSLNNNTTSWAMNTRSNALTEYRNWAFNSFASMGRRYLGASQQGLFELNGARDGTEDTTADIAAGYLELADGKLSGLKGVYLGLSGQGTYLLNLVGGDGTTRTYQFVSQPELMTTKVIVGKGIRTRYLRWELISTGPDFDFDEIEFVPMISGRRV
jgi:hypothetical protein